MISVMSSNDCEELERGSEVSDEFPTFEMETPEEDKVDVDMVEKPSVDGSEGVCEGTEGESAVKEMDSDGTGIDSDELVRDEMENTKVEVRDSDWSQSSGGDGDSNDGDMEPVKTGYEEARVHSEDVDREMESGPSDVKVEPVESKDHFAGGEDELDLKAVTAEEEDRASPEEAKEDTKMMIRERSDSDFSYAYSRVDEGSATRMTEAFGSEAARALSYGFEPGDMVWGKVKSHPWWPGHIFSEAFASPSVRHSKRKGHLLVAFFGDSSYGWFDPAELIHFDPHYSEKSRQTSSRVFMRAVEEAVEEARRRAALGLTCYCRNPFNFRPTNGQGYFAVDVGGYEPGGLYSVKEIKKARENFRPSQALSFVKQLAVKPRDDGQRGLDWIKNVALFLAYRKATFEEFDETYAQAFGMQPARPSGPSRDSVAVADQLVKSRAPLSGPMVFAEALGEVKSSTKSPKVKDKSRKNKYVLKRRDKLDKPKQHKLSQGNAGFAASSSSGEGGTAITPPDYILQKRSPAVSVEAQEEIGAANRGNAALASEDSQPVVSSSSTSSVQEGPEGGMLLMDGNMNVIPRGEDGSVVMEVLEPLGSVDSLTQDSHRDSRDVFAFEMEETAVSSYPPEGLEESKLTSLSAGTDSSGMDYVQEPGDTTKRILDSVPDGVVCTSSDRVFKKAKILKSTDDLNSDKTGMVEKKKKKKKKKIGLEVSSDQHLQKPFKKKDVESYRKTAGKSVGIGLAHAEDMSVDMQKKQDGASSTLTKGSLQSVEFETLLTDLLALALDPFHGADRDSPEVVQHVFLQFRNHVYQKSLFLVPMVEDEATEQFVGKYPAGDDAGAGPSRKSKPGRPDDPTKAGRKRGPSDRQEEKSAKRLKKVKELKSLSAEKKAASQKIPEQREVEGNEGVADVPSKLTKPVSAKKSHTPVRMAEPMMLVMKFPPRTNLPSVPELKAKFARFGPLDPSTFRVFWKSSTCRVVFKHKAHAQAAYHYAVRNHGLFGQMKVNYQLREVAAPTSEVPESVRHRVDDASDDIRPFRPGKGNTNDSVGDPQHPQQSSIHLKSCLKKPSREEVSPATGAPRENPRVKFILGGEEGGTSTSTSNSSSSIRGERLMASSAKLGASSSTSSSSVAMDVNRTNLPKVVIPSTLPPLLPLPTRNLDVDVNRGLTPFVPKVPIKNVSKVEQEQRNTNHQTTTTTSNNSTDFSSQMLILMMRCNDIVMDVKSSLGYVPYHQL